MNAVPERLWLLLSLKLAGEAGPEELSELEALLKAHPEAALKAGMLKRIWKNPAPSASANTDQAFSRHMQRLSTHLSQPVLQYEVPGGDNEPESTGTNKKRWWMAGIAASLLVCALLWLIPGKEPEAKALSHVVSTRHGSKSKIELPDGTVVWLNSGSKLMYDEAFNGSQREVRLEGEAYFDVAKDKSRPFIIHTQSIDLKVLGTAFNLRAYPDEATTETALIHGSVEVKVLNNPDKMIVLKPAEKLVVQNRQEPIAPAAELADQEPEPLISVSRVHQIRQDSTLYETSWVSNRLAFDSEPLELIAKRLERWFDVTILIANDSLKQITYTADFDGESLDEVLIALQMSGGSEGFKYSINRKEVIIKP